MCIYNSRMTDYVKSSNKLAIGLKNLVWPDQNALKIFFLHSHLFFLFPKLAWAFSATVVLMPPSSSPIKRPISRTKSRNPLQRCSLFASRLFFFSVYESLLFTPEAIQFADRALVSHLQWLSEFKRVFDEFRSKDTKSLDSGLSIGSCLKAQAEENQSKLRSLDTVSNKLQEEIDQKDCKVSALIFWVLFIMRLSSSNAHQLFDQMSKLTFFQGVSCLC